MSALMTYDALDLVMCLGEVYILSDPLKHCIVSLPRSTWLSKSITNLLLSLVFWNLISATFYWTMAKFVIAGFCFLSCRSLPPHPIVYKGHSDSILDFSVWGQDIISISKNKIGLSSLAGTVDEVSTHTVDLLTYSRLRNISQIGQSFGQ